MNCNQCNRPLIIVGENKRVCTNVKCVQYSGIDLNSPNKIVKTEKTDV